MGVDMSKENKDLIMTSIYYVCFTTRDGRTHCREITVGSIRELSKMAKRDGATIHSAVLLYA